MSSITNYVFCEYMYIICDDIALFVSAVVPLVSNYCFCFLFCLSLSWLDFWLGSTWLCLSLFRFALWKKSQFLKCSRTRPVFIIWEKHYFLQMLYQLMLGESTMRQRRPGPATFKLLTVTKNMSSIKIMYSVSTCIIYMMISHLLSQL